jgi:hypothetical protein
MVRDFPQVPTLEIALSEQVTEAVPQLSVAVGAVTFEQVGTAGLHPKSPPEGQPTRVGGAVSSVQVYVAEHVEELVHASVAVQVMVRDFPQVLVFTTASAEQETVAAPHASVAVGAVTLAQVGITGLHPKLLPTGQSLSVGGVVSTAYV